MARPSEDIERLLGIQLQPWQQEIIDCIMAEHVDKVIINAQPRAGQGAAAVGDPHRRVT